jgi:hypothetical protein
MSKAQGIAQSANQGNFKNRIINGAMMIDQRNAGASVTTTSGQQYLVDRWKTENSEASKYSVQQNAGSVTPPPGFTNYLGVTSLSAYSIGSGDYFTIRQIIEGFNIADFNWGAANATPITISFWVRSSLTGTFGASIKNNNSDYNYPFSYTISAANTWEQKTITVAGPTSGAWVTNNSVGLQLYFSLGVGSTYSGTAGSWTTSNVVSTTGATSVVGTSGATFYITGVQLEKGSTATSFDYRPYGTELALCQRYFYSLGGTAYEVFGFGAWRNSTTACILVKHSVPMRVQPTLNVINLASTWLIASGINTATSANIDQNDLNSTMIDLGGVTQSYSNFARWISGNNTSTRVQLSSEL